jgi:hypothetical protein
LVIQDRKWLVFAVQNCFEGKAMVNWVRARTNCDAAQAQQVIRHSPLPAQCGTTRTQHSAAGNPLLHGWFLAMVQHDVMLC